MYLPSELFRMSTPFHKVTLKAPPPAHRKETSGWAAARCKGTDQIAQTFPSVVKKDQKKKIPKCSNEIDK